MPARVRSSYYRATYSVGGKPTRTLWVKVRAVVTVSAAIGACQVGEGTPIVVGGTVAPDASGCIVRLDIYKASTEGTYEWYAATSATCVEAPAVSPSGRPA